MKSGETVRPEDIQLNHSSSETPTKVMSIQKKCDVWTLIKKNAFLILTIVAVAVGKRNVLNLICFRHDFCFLHLWTNPDFLICVFVPEELAWASLCERLICQLGK